MLSTEDSAKVRNAKEALMGTLKHFIGLRQRSVLADTLRGEERVAIAEIVLRVEAQIKAAPKTYETDVIETADKVFQLHYFGGPVDAWIVERDQGDSPGGPGFDEQTQAFGKITLTGDKDDAEWGYISIQDLIENHIELDLCWTPKTAKEL